MQFYTETGRFAFLSPSFESLGSTHAVPLRLIGKWLSISVNWTFFARCYHCYGWRATSQYRLKICVFAPTGSVWPRISGIRGRPPQTILLVRKLGCFMRFFVLPESTRLTDGQTDRQKGLAIPLARCSAVKTIPAVTVHFNYSCTGCHKKKNSVRFIFSTSLANTTCNCTNAICNNRNDKTINLTDILQFET